MLIFLKSVVTEAELKTVRDLIALTPFSDGKSTSSLSTKNNLQLAVDSEPARAAAALVMQGLERHPLFRLGVFARSSHIIFSRYEVGMEYPEHVDAAVVATVRADVAVTVFLNDKYTYMGGELVVHTDNGERSYREEAGNAIAYPASMLHSVAPVTRGTRLAAVLWIQSMIRDAEKRSVLYELGRALEGLEEKDAAMPRLRRTYWNLVRMWTEA